MATFVEVLSSSIDRRSPFPQGDIGNEAFYVSLPANRRTRACSEAYFPDQQPYRPVNVLILATGSARIAPLVQLLHGNADADGRPTRLRELQLIDSEIPVAERARGVAPDVILTRLQTGDDDALAGIARLPMVWNIPVIATLTSELALAETQLLAKTLDDYLLEPARPEELLIRIHFTVWRHRAQPHPTTRRLPEAVDDDIALRIDDESKSVSLCGRPLQLTPKEFELLRLLASESGRVFSDAEIIGKLWPHSTHAAAVDVAQYVHRLRKKLRDDPCAPQWIFNIKRFGYMLKRIPTRSDSRNSQ